jgi:hypothetical protein
MNERDSGGQSPPSVIGEVLPFDPGPSVAAAATALSQQGSLFALIGGLALDAWGIPRATKDAGFAVPVGAAEKAADALRTPSTEVRPLRIGGVGVRDTSRALRIDLVDRRFHFAPLFDDDRADVYAQIIIGSASTIQKRIMAPFLFIDRRSLARLKPRAPSDDVRRSAEASRSI